MIQLLLHNSKYNLLHGFPSQRLKGVDSPPQTPQKNFWHFIRILDECTSFVVVEVQRNFVVHLHNEIVIPIQLKTHIFWTCSTTPKKVILVVDDV